MLSVRRLQIFAAVAEHGSFSAAALALTYTQSAISQQMVQLEREAGAQLVVRSTRGVRLTPAGQVLLRHARGLIDHLTCAEADVRALAELKGGCLRVAAFPSAWGALMPQAAQTFSKRYPDVELGLADANTDVSLERLASGALDLAVICGSAAIQASAIADRVSMTPLLEDPYFIVVAPAHRLAARRSARLDELANEPWVMPSQSSQMIRVACERAGFSPATHLQADGWQAVQGLVACGLGVALLPGLALLPRRDDVVVLDVDDTPPSRQVCAAVPAGQYSHPAAKAMTQILGEVVVWRERRRVAASRGPRSLPGSRRAIPDRHAAATCGAMGDPGAPKAAAQ